MTISNITPNSKIYFRVNYNNCSSFSNWLTKSQLKDRFIDCQEAKLTLCVKETERNQQRRRSHSCSLHLMTITSPRLYLPAYLRHTVYRLPLYSSTILFKKFTTRHIDLIHHINGAAGGVKESKTGNAFHKKRFIITAMLIPKSALVDRWSGQCCKKNLHRPPTCSDRIGLSVMFMFDAIDDRFEMNSVRLWLRCNNILKLVELVCDLWLANWSQ